ncbi:hypothetical protein OK074_4676 [Actinobacteria bacterium OK074]|nr:hypothetical protein OK074_4676 [Actinobacteria bacterium OK074]
MIHGPFRFSVAENQFYVLEDDDLDYLKHRTTTAADNNGLAAAGRNHLYVIAGISAGVAMMTFDLSPAPLEQDRSQPWEDVVESDYVSALGTAHLTACMGPDEETPQRGNPHPVQTTGRP